MTVNYYKLLSVPRSASAEDLKKAWRREALRFHPDQNPDDPVAEERFKRLNEAYNTLIDPSRRRLYDLYGTGDIRQVRHVRMRRESAVFSFIRTAASAAQQRMRAESGDDIRLTSTIPFVDAARGCVRVFELPRRKTPNSEHTVMRRLEFTIPAGVMDGQRLRWRGEGGPGIYGGRHGDLYVRVRVEAHPFFSRSGYDVVCPLPLTLLELTRGGSVQVPTIRGPATLAVPAGVEVGSELRIAGAGLPRRGADAQGAAGDAVFRVTMDLPRVPDEAQIAALGAADELLRDRRDSRRAAFEALVAECDHDAD